MFTVLSNTRNSNLYLIAALAVMAIVLVTFSLAPKISTSQAATVPVTELSAAGSDYYQRHLDLRAPAAGLNGDFALRHPEWMTVAHIVAIPVTGGAESLDYFQRHPELLMPAVITADTADYFTRHPELRPSVPSTNLSDYFQRH
jgi:hypothetical protein